MYRTYLGWLRIVSFIEGTSLVLLMFVAVPVKRLLYEPIFVQIIGPIHGFLFLGLLLVTIIIAMDKSWNYKIVLKIFLASVIPFGNLYIDSKILKPMWEEEKNI